jgi:hypothetical protein
MVHKRRRVAALTSAIITLASLATAGPAAAAEPVTEKAAAAAASPEPIIDIVAPKDRKSAKSGAKTSTALDVWNPLGTEPTLPYPVPSDAATPKRGCATTVSSPTAPPATSTNSIQFIYAWHDGNGNRYEQYVEQIAKIIDRVDWAIDNSTDYDQHLNLSCRTGYDTSTYSGYAHALVVPEKIEAGNLTGGTTIETVRDDLTAAGYDDPNRWYFVFQDFSGNSAAWTHCKTAGGAGCVGVAEAWDTGIIGHELGHLLGAPHAWSKEDGGAYYADIMYGWQDYWMYDQDFNTYYDPSELSASFYLDPYPSTTKYNIANHPALTVPTPGDVGFSNDLLTAQERTIEADAPWATPTGFTASGGVWTQVTPPGSDSAVSAKYYDGRRSLTANVQSYAEGVVSVTRQPAVTAGTRYKFFARLNTATSGNVKLRLSWYNASNALISNSDGPLIALDASWNERSYSAVAPTGATSVKVSVVSPSGQTFSYVLDSLQLNYCNNTANTSDGCRTSV